MKLIVWWELNILISWVLCFGVRGGGIGKMTLQPCHPLPWHRAHCRRAEKYQAPHSRLPKVSIVLSHQWSALLRLVIKKGEQALQNEVNEETNQAHKASEVVYKFTSTIVVTQQSWHICKGSKVWSSSVGQVVLHQSGLQSLKREKTRAA